MKNGKFTVGIIGLDFGERHLKAAIDNKLEVVGICDMRDGRVYRRDRKWQAHTHTRRGGSKDRRYLPGYYRIRKDG